MKFYNVVLLCVVLLVLSCNVWCADRIQDGDPGTIGAIISQSDGSQVTLESEQVIWRGRSGKSFAIKEYFEARPKQPRLVVISTRSLPVKDTYTVDVTGTLSTVAGTSEDGSPITQRVVIATPENIKVYCDSKGRPMVLPPVKSLGMTEWLHKKTLTELAGVSAASVSAMDSGYPVLNDAPDSNPFTPTEGSRDGLKWIPDGSQVHLRNRLIVGRINSSFCIEEPDRTSSIRVGTTNYSADTGNLVDIVGTLTTNSGERYVQADTDGVTITESSCAIPRPFGMPNKSVGGGAVGMFTPGVGEAVGPNNTGMLATVWGTVTAADLYNSTGNYYYCIDDGSGVASEAYPTGIRVFGDWDYPYEGDYVIVTGVIHCDNGYASVTKLENTYPTYSSGSGTISGTITSGPSASGLTARIHSTCGSTTCLLNASGSGSYTLNAKPGNHTVSVDVAGYGHAAQKATVINSQTTTKNFTLTSIGKDIYVYTSSPRIAPDGISTTTVTAMVFDEEGRRLPNQPVTWNVDLGTIVSSDSVTNIVGEAYLVVQSTTNHETATVWAETGSVGDGCYVEYADEGDPYIIITSPTGGDVSGFVTVNVWAQDDDITDSVSDFKIYIDGVQKGYATTNEYRPTGIETEKLSNGWHALRVLAMDDEYAGMWSQEIQMHVCNPISNLQIAQSEIVIDEPNPGNISFNAVMNEIGTWSIEIKNHQGTVVYSNSGANQGVVSANWDGKVDGNYILGVYTATLSASTASGTSTKVMGFAISQAHTAGALICGMMRGEKPENILDCIEEMNRVGDACFARGIPRTFVIDPLWDENEDIYSSTPPVEDPNEDSYFRRGIKYYLRQPHSAFFFVTHGAVIYCHEDGKWRSVIAMNDASGPNVQANVVGESSWMSSPSRVRYRAFSDLNIAPDQYRIVEINACHSGGSWLHGVLEVDIPHAFGNYGRVEEDKTYIGWDTYYISGTDPILQGFGPNGTGWTREFWKYLGQYYSVSQAISEVYWHGIYKGWMHNYLYVYGGPDATWLSPW